MTTTKLARRVDISQAQISRLEDGVQGFRSSRLFGAAEALTKEAKEAVEKGEDAVCDLKAVNPNRKPKVDTGTPEELLDIIEAKGKEIAEVLAMLRGDDIG